MRKKVEKYCPKGIYTHFQWVVSWCGDKSKDGTLGVGWITVVPPFPYPRNQSGLCTTVTVEVSEMIHMKC